MKRVFLFICLLFLFATFLNAQFSVLPESVEFTLEPDEVDEFYLFFTNGTMDYVDIWFSINYITESFKSPPSNQDDNWLLIDTGTIYMIPPSTSMLYLMSVGISSYGLADTTKTAELIVHTNDYGDFPIFITLHVLSLSEHNPPSNAGYEIFNDHIHLYWEPPVNTTLNVLEYHIYVDGVMYITTNLYFDIYDLIAGQVYDVALTALYEDNIESDPILFSICFLGSDDLLNLETIHLSIYPNPFNPCTTISFSVTQTSSSATIEIYNLRGQKVKVLTFPNKGLGTRERSVTWNGTDDNGRPVASGVYYCRLKSGEYQEVRKLVLMK
jgi:hypothetical protein